MKGPLLLVVDDDRSAREYLTLLLRENGYSVEEAGNGVEAVLAIESRLPELVISDLRMPRMDGLHLLAHLKTRWPHIPFVLLTVVEDVATVVEAIQQGATNYLVKPASPAGILSVVKRSLNTSKGKTPSPGAVPELLGNTAGMVEVRRLVCLAAASDVNVLVTGETGTGKELVARAIHRYSVHAAGPFVAHNCAATPHDLFESQFFGHRKGAFTGALDDHPGLLVQANGGVLLLDELQALSPHNQAKFLRVLDDGEVRALGSNHAQQVSVRFLAATNVEPRGLLRSGALREDLYYRLRGLEIRLPPLRERREDVALLARSFLEVRGSFTAEALEALAAYSWPGNVRQLRNVVRGASALAGAGLIDTVHLALEPAPASPGGESGEAREGDGWRPGTLKDLERVAIREALLASRGNLSRAARALGIDRSTLRRKLRGVEGESLGKN
jgi:DNA-binding NtrC family response regulator